MKSTDKLISANAFFKRICDDTSIRGSAFAAIRRHIDAAPAVEAQPVKHGRLGKPFGEFADCLECGTDNLLPCRYCRECGAKMDGDVNG